MPVYSHSRLSSFEKCPLQYRYRYIERIQRDTQSIETFMGSRVHEVLERLYRDLLALKTPGLEDLVALYHRSWKSRYSGNVRIVKEEYSADHYRGIGERCVTSYYRRHEPFAGAATLGLEERVTLDLDAAQRGRYQLQGYVDRLARADDGAFEIHDYKTSSSLPADAELKRDRQLALYQMAVQSRYPEAQRVRLVWHYLAHDRTLTSERTPEELERHRRQTIGVIRTIEATREFPPHESALCRWCEYRDICPAQRHLVQAEAAARAAAGSAAATPAATPPAATPPAGAPPAVTRPAAAPPPAPADRLAGLRDRRRRLLLEAARIGKELARVDREIAAVEEAAAEPAGAEKAGGEHAGGEPAAPERSSPQAGLFEPFSGRRPAPPAG
ncbi:MAG: RecB family exonuclease [Candidatus Polarisedimenticolia bacterium]